jgi:hypothetical protein
MPTGSGAALNLYGFLDDLVESLAPSTLSPSK